MRVNIIVSATDELSIMETNVGHIGEHNISTLVFSGEIFEAEYYRLAFRRLCKTLESEKLQLVDGQIVYPLPQSLLKSRSLEVQLVGYTSENGEITKIQKSDIIQLQISPSIQSPSNQLNNTANDNGPQGQTPNLQIGEVTTLPAGSDATASITGTPENPLLNLGLPCGGAKLINRIELTEDVSAVTIDRDLNGKVFNLKKAEIHFCIPSANPVESIPPTENVPDMATAAMTINNIEGVWNEDNYTYSGGYLTGYAENQPVIPLDSFFKIGDFMYGISENLSLSVIGNNESYNVMGNTFFKGYAGGMQNPDGGYDFYLTHSFNYFTTANESEVWEYIYSVKIYSDSDTLLLPAGTVVEIWGY